MSYELNSIGLRNIKKEHMGITSDLDSFNFPGSGTAETESFDYGDTKNAIIINGEYSASSIEDLINWIISIWALQTGDQDTIIFHSDFLDYSTIGDYQDGNVLVKVHSFDWDYVEGRPLVVTWNLKMVESI